MALEFFISHSHKDQALADRLINFFVEGVGVEKKEVRCTSSVLTGLNAGSHINDSLRKDLKKCRYFVPLVTANSIKSQFVMFEIGAAWVMEKEIIPFFAGELEKSQLPTLLSSFLHQDTRDVEGLIKLAEYLSTEIFYKSDRPSASEIASAAARLAGI
jgi:hypothetical protein